MTDKGWVIYKADDSSDWENSEAEWHVGTVGSSDFTNDGCVDFTCGHHQTFQTFDEAIAYVKERLP